MVSSEPELQAAETLYGQLVSMLSDNGDAPEAAGLLRRVVDACDAVLSPAASDELRIAALTLSADAHDRIATRRVTAPVTVPPAGMYSASQGYTPEAYRAVFTQHRRRSLAWMYCDAAARYEQALAIDPSDPRATAQLHAYGANFVAYCEAMRRRSEPLRDQRGR